MSISHPLHILFSNPLLTSTPSTPSRSAKAQWDEALQSAIRSFRLLASQSSSSSKAWKPVVPPTAAQAASSSSTSAQPRTVPSTPAGSVAQRNGSRRPSVAPAGMTPNASPVKGKSRDDGRFASFPSSPSQQRVSSGRAAAAPFPSRALPFAPQSVESSAVRIHKRSGGKSIGLPTGVDVYRAVVDVPFDGVPDLEGFKASLGVPEARTKCKYHRGSSTASISCLAYPHPHVHSF